MLTGYGSIANAVEAMRRGAINYVTKPADADQILQAFAEPADGRFSSRRSGPQATFIGRNGMESYPKRARRLRRQYHARRQNTGDTAVHAAAEAEEEGTVNEQRAHAV